MPRVAIEEIKRDPFFQGTTFQRRYILALYIFGQGMPTGRPTDLSEAGVVLNFNQSVAINEANARAAIISNVRDQGITIADDAQIDLVARFFNAL